MTMISSDYQSLWVSSSLTEDDSSLLELDGVAKTAIYEQPLYESVEKMVSIPWVVIAAIHFRESNQSFKHHLHNGDPLTARTVHVPVGRPAIGTPPFTWMESAIDALSDRWIPIEWDMVGCLEFMERYNGLGYQKHGINSPYLWDFTNKYTQGLFSADGKFDPALKESRPGCVSILIALAEKGISLDFTSLPGRSSSIH